MYFSPKIGFSFLVTLPEENEILQIFILNVYSLEINIFIFMLNMLKHREEHDSEATIKSTFKSSSSQIEQM